MSFEDVAVYSLEERRLLGEAQRCLYLSVMLQNFALMSSLAGASGTVLRAAGGRMSLPSSW